MHECGVESEEQAQVFDRCFVDQLRKMWASIKDIAPVAELRKASARARSLLALILRACVCVTAKGWHWETLGLHN